MRMARSWITVAALGAVLVLAAGCGPKTDRDKPGKAKAVTSEGEDHSHGNGPHGGTLSDWNEEGKDDGKYHVEFTVDHKKQEATVYVLKGDAKTAAPIAADRLRLKIKEPPFEVELKPVPQDKDGEGKSSRFAGKHEKLGKEQEFEGTISGEIDGKKYSGQFKEEEEKKK